MSFFSSSSSKSLLLSVSASSPVSFLHPVFFIRHFWRVEDNRKGIAVHTQSIDDNQLSSLKHSNSVVVVVAVIYFLIRVVVMMMMMTTLDSRAFCFPRSGSRSGFFRFSPKLSIGSIVKAWPTFIIPT